MRRDVIVHGAADSPNWGGSAARGPDGAHWPEHTPAYTTAATTFVSSLSDLQAAIDAASSGDVIEVSAHTHAGLTVSGGSTGWANNVLVRPPIGQRQSVIVDGRLNITGDHITIAGFKVNEDIRGTGATRSAFARTVLTTFGYSYVITDTTDFGLYEIVRPDYGVGGDAGQIKASTTQNVRTVMSGCWIKGQWRFTGDADHNDTLQTISTVTDLLIEDTVLWTSGDKSIQTDGGLSGLVMDNVFANEPDTATEQPPEGQEKYGSHVITSGGYNATARGCVIVGSVSNTDTNPWDEVSNTRYTSWGPITSASGNSIESGTFAEPDPLADLDTIWD